MMTDLHKAQRRTISMVSVQHIDCYKEKENIGYCNHLIIYNNLCASPIKKRRDVRTPDIAPGQCPVTIWWKLLKHWFVFLSNELSGKINTCLIKKKN